MDGFDQDEGAGECEERGIVSCGLLATLGDAFEVLDLAHHLLDQGAPYKKAW